MPASSGLGFALAGLSAVLNGSFVVFSKLPSVRAAGVDPLVFQMWTCFGVFLSSLLCMPFISGSVYPAAALGWGILAGGLFVVAVSFSFVAVQLVGLSIAQGIWSGSGVLIAFCWGVGAFGDRVEAGTAAAGLILIVGGVLGIAMSSDIAACIGSRSHGDLDVLHAHSVGHDSLSHATATLGFPRDPRSGSSSDTMQRTLLEEAGSGTITPFHARRDSEEFGHEHPAAVKAKLQKSSGLPAPPMLSDALTFSHFSHQHQALAVDSGAQHDDVFDAPLQHDAYAPTSSSSDDDVHPEDLHQLQRQRQLYGSSCALIVGIFGGSILAPLQLAPEAVRGLSFVPSFGLGTLLVAPLITLPYMYLSRALSSRGSWAVRASLLPGLMAGAVWNGANVCSIYAVESIGYSVAYPLMQCAIAIAALWGVLVFKEIRGKQIGVMAASAIVVLGGAVLLALSRK